jgi:hypothetical protein
VARVFLTNLRLRIASKLNSSDRAESAAIVPPRLQRYAWLHRKLEEAGAAKTKSTWCGFCGVRRLPCALLALFAWLALLALLVPMALQRLRLAPPSTVAPLPAALPHRILARLMIHAHKGSMPT